MMRRDVIDKVVTAARAQPCDWNMLFRREGAGWQCVLFPRTMLSPAEYSETVRQLKQPSPDEVKRNRLRARAEAVRR
jgi:hypothetical protein